MTPFENALFAELASIRQTFADRDVGHLNVKIEAEGPSMRDELKITFSVSEYGYGEIVTGSNLAACVNEYFRRRGWKASNDYLALPNVKSDDT